MFAIQLGHDLGVDISSDVLKEAEGFVAWQCPGLNNFLRPTCFRDQRTLNGEKLP